MIITRNGASVGTLTEPDTDNLQPVSALNQNVAINVNFGQREFSFAPPAGYLPLVTTSLPDPAIANPKSVMDIDLYNGTGSTNARSNFSFSPELAWIKWRANGSYSHNIFDAVRGATKVIYSDSSTTEGTDANSLTSFDANGFTLGSAAPVNNSGTSYVAWAWDAENSANIAVGDENSSAYYIADWESTFPTTGSTQPVGSPGNLFRGGGNHLQASSFTATWDLSSYNITCNTVTITGEYRQGITYSVTGSNGTTTFNQQIGNGNHTLTATNVGTLSQITFGTSSTSSSWGIAEIKIDGKRLYQTGQLSTATQYPSIASTCRTNQSAGFSICSYQGSGGSATVSHNCNATPGLIIIKNRTATAHWYVYHSGLASGKALNLNQTGGEFTPGQAGITAVSSSFFTLGSSRGETNASGNNYIAYCWAPVEGVSAMGVYTGSSNLPFVYTGFKVGFILLKRKDSSGDWIMHDTTRKPSNGTSDNNTLVANVSNGEDGYYTATQVEVDYLSNGFKLRHTGGPLNDTGAQYIWAAWASNPFKHQSRAN